jgi:DNA-binding LacI/PurR family transcriptional regulator
VFFDSGIEGSGIPRVLADDTRGARAVVDYMLSIGRKRVAHIGSGTDEPGRKRLEGYVSALKARGVHVDESIIKLREYSRGWGFYAAREILESPSRPDAIFCGNDSIAAGALRCLREMRVKCPAEISVAGFGDTPLAEDLDLTSVSQPCDVIAAAAWKNLQTILRGGSPPAETVIETGLVLRKSAAPPG